jgi:superfamily II DNA or RNA helicase
MQPSTTFQIELIQSLFRGRDDVFSVRWEKDGKSGYMPAYDFDRAAFARHKQAGGSLKDFPDKTYSALTHQRLNNHLTGIETLGIYPLLEDASSWFIVADFDQNESAAAGWLQECRAFINACEQHKIPAYLERSRSGNGGHVWIFFESNYPAYKSRAIVLHLLEAAGILSPLDKNSNYDRLFPNQDHHSGKGLGNLIALPLQKKPLENGNSCFIEPETCQPYQDQWSFLNNINRVSTAQLDACFQLIAGNEVSVTKYAGTDDGILQIYLNKQVMIFKKHLKRDLATFLKERLNFVNSDYIIRKRLGKNTYGTTPYFKMLDEQPDCILLPKGFVGNLMRYCTANNINHTLVDERRKLHETRFNFKAALYKHQEAALAVTEKKEMGIIVAPPGSGKTIIGLAIIAQKRQPALIIVHRRQLFVQWVERIESFLGIANSFIGKIMPGKQKIGAQVTVAMIQSLAGIDESDELFKSFGMIIIDECHHVPAKTFRQAITKFETYYQYGLTATPVRKTSDERLIFIHIGEIIHEIKQPQKESEYQGKATVTVRETALFVPFDYKTDKLETLYQILAHDAARNQLIADDVVAETGAGRKVLVLTERKTHIEALYQYLKGRVEIITLSGDDSGKTAREKMQAIKDGQFQLLISTGQFLGEGIDIDSLNCLMLAFPLAFEGKLEQYMGRVMRSEIAPVIYDYRDVNVEFLERQYRQRAAFYRKLYTAGQLQKQQELLLVFNGDTVFINSENWKLPISCLDLPQEVERFNEDVVWKLRVIIYDGDNCELRTEIIDYNAAVPEKTGEQIQLQFWVVDKITFRNISTSLFLSSVVLKKTSLPPPKEKLHYTYPETSSTVIPQQITEGPELQRTLQPVERFFSDTVKIPFSEINFDNAFVHFSVFIEPYGDYVRFEIENPDIRPEFEAVKEYFSKILKKKQILANVEIRYSGKTLISASASSADIDMINNSIIESVRFEFVKRDIIGFKTASGNDAVLNTLDNIDSGEKLGETFFKSDEDLIDNILAVKNSKHNHQLKHLAAQHQSQVLKLRFILNPFSFLFLLAGEKQYHLVWETLYSDEATYIWHFEKNMDALRKGLHDVEQILNEIKLTGRRDFLKRDQPGFSRIIHDYSDAKSGFVSWKGTLEERLL